MARVVLAMSGGVDSSVAAWLLRERGHEVIGLFMRHGQATRESPCGAEGAHCGAAAAGSESAPPAAADPSAARPKQGCCSAADAADARRVAALLGIPFFALDFEPEFERIIRYFVDEYAAGRTPNPCVVCNAWLKFGRLFDYANGVGAEFVATGHYARVTAAGGESSLHRGRDAGKDQSYALFGVARELLPRLMLPIGELTKAEVRETAVRLSLSVAEKPDSQEICFVPDHDHARFVRARRGGETRPGEIVTLDGRVVGHHAGIEAFTVGQRKGLGVALGDPHYVVRIEAETGRVVLGRREDLANDGLEADRANWLCRLPDRFRCTLQIRYRSGAMPATITRGDDGRFRAKFDAPCFGVAPGQAAVCYEGDRLLGGGWIVGGSSPAMRGIMSRH